MRLIFGTYQPKRQLQRKKNQSLLKMTSKRTRSTSCNQGHHSGIQDKNQNTPYWEKRLERRQIGQRFSEQGPEQPGLPLARVLLWIVGWSRDTQGSFLAIILHYTVMFWNIFFPKGYFI